MELFASPGGSFDNRQEWTRICDGKPCVDSSNSEKNGPEDPVRRDHNCPTRGRSRVLRHAKAVIIATPLTRQPGILLATKDQDTVGNSRVREIDIMMNSTACPRLPLGPKRSSQPGVGL